MRMGRPILVRVGAALGAMSSAALVRIGVSERRDDEPDGQNIQAQNRG